DEAVGEWSSSVMCEGAETILFEKDRDLWLQPIGTKAAARRLFPSPFNERHACVSPDQRLIAYTSDETGQDEVFVRSFPSGEHKGQVSIGGGITPRWLPGSDGLVFRANDEVVRVRAANGDFGQA